MPCADAAKHLAGTAAVELFTGGAVPLCRRCAIQTAMNVMLTLLHEAFRLDANGNDTGSVRTAHDIYRTLSPMLQAFMSSADPAELRLILEAHVGASKAN